MLKILQIAVSISTGQECFLDTPEWIEIFDAAACQPSSTVQRRVTYEYLKIFARLATIVRNLREETENTSPLTTRLIAELWIEVYALYQKVNLAMHDPKVVLEVDSNDNDIPFATYYKFSKVQVCETFCHAWKIFILISAMMQHYLPDQLTSKAQSLQVQAAINICKCFEFVRPLKPFGTFFMHLNLPRAAAALRDPYRSWAMLAYKELVESGLAVGFDMAAPTKLLKQWTVEWNQSSVQKWWLGG